MIKLARLYIVILQPGEAFVWNPSPIHRFVVNKKIKPRKIFSAIFLCLNFVNVLSCLFHISFNNGFEAAYEKGRVKQQNENTSFSGKDKKLISFFLFMQIYSFNVILLTV